MPRLQYPASCLVVREEGERRGRERREKEEGERGGREKRESEEGER